MPFGPRAHPTHVIPGTKAQLPSDDLRATDSDTPTLGECPEKTEAEQESDPLLLRRSKSSDRIEAVGEVGRGSEQFPRDGLVRLWVMTWFVQGTNAVPKSVESRASFEKPSAFECFLPF